VGLFPSYIFAHLDVQHDDAWRLVHSTVGVTRLLGASGLEPVPVRQDVMDALLAHNGVVEDLRDALPFITGEQVVFAQGPLQGHSGKVLQASRNRVALLFSILGRETVIYSAPELLRTAALQVQRAPLR
jgi:transcription antitermination factor NusG